MILHNPMAKLISTFDIRRSTFRALTPKNLSAEDAEKIRAEPRKESRENQFHSRVSLRALSSALLCAKKGNAQIVLNCSIRYPILLPIKISKK